MRLSRYVLYAALILMISCKKDDYLVFDDSPRIQFGPDISRIYTPSFNLADTLKPYTFYYETAVTVKDTVYFDIYAIGGVSDKSRYFKLEQEIMPGINNAVPAKQYIAFDDASLKEAYSIPAGQVHALVPIVLLRDATLATSTVVLKLKVADNESFKMGESNNTWRKVEFTDRLSQPAAWNASGVLYYYGKYSTTKHKFMVEQTGEKWDQVFMTTIAADYALQSFWTGKLKTLLVNYNNAHPGDPLKDESGELVLFP